MSFGRDASMSSHSTTSSLGPLIKSQLQDPLRLRFILCGVLLLGWYFGHHSPATDYIQLTTTRTEAEKKRIATAQQVEMLRKRLAPYQSRIPKREGQNELIQYVMAHVRKTPLKLVDLNPGKNEDMGTLRAIELKLKLEGSYADLDGFLSWVEHEQRLLRIDSLKVQQAGAQKRGLGIELTLTGLVDAQKTPAPQKEAAKVAAKAKDVPK